MMRIFTKPLFLISIPFIILLAGIWLEASLRGHQPVSTILRLMSLPPEDIQLSSPLWDYRTAFSPEWKVTDQPGGLREYSWAGTFHHDPEAPGVQIFSGANEVPILTPSEWGDPSRSGYLYSPSREKLILKNYFFAADHIQFFVAHLDWRDPILEWESLTITSDNSPVKLCLAFDDVWATTKEISCDDWMPSSLPTSGVAEGTRTLYLRSTGIYSTVDKAQQKQLFLRNMKVRSQASVSVRIPTDAPVPIIRYRPLEPVETLLSQPEPPPQPLQGSPWDQYDESLLFVRPMEIDGLVRTGVFLPTPSEWRTSLTLNQPSSLVFYPTVRDPSDQTAWGSADLEVLLDTGTATRTLWKGEINPQTDTGHSAWKQGIRIPVEPMPGGQATLVFRSRNMMETGAKSQPLLLGEPHLVVSAKDLDQSFPEKPRSIILISVDTLRADAVGCIGGKNTTPWMDQFFGDKGVVWTNTEAPSSWTLPSHASLMLSQYLSRHGVVMHYDRIPTGAVTLAEHFGLHHYETAAFVDREFLNYRFGFQQGFILFDQIGGHFKSSMPRCLSFLRNRNRDVPLFLFLHSYDTHDPYTPPDEYRKRFVREGLKPTAPALDIPNRQFLKLMHVSQGEAKLSESDVEFVHSLYLAEVAYVDDMLRDFFNQVRQEQLLDDPLVVLVSDHGEAFNEHKTFIHAFNLYEEVIRVPVLFRFPGEQHARHRLEGRTNLIDVPPTLFDVLGWEIPEDWQGVSLLPQMTDPALPLPSRKFYSELVKDNRTLFALTQWSHKFINTVRDDIEGKKLVRSREVEAYDLEKDPGETRNLAYSELQQATKELDQTGQELSKMYDLLHSEGSFEPADLDPATIRSLQAIGYMQPEINPPKAGDPQPAATQIQE